MDLDPDVSRWVFEFLLRNPEMDSLAKRLLAFVPISDHDLRLKKTILLRSIESQILEDAVVSESILDSLESIEALDRREGVPATEAMKAAYCAVATEITVKFLACSGGKATGKYMEAVDRVWRGRVRVLEETEGCELVAAEAREMRDELEAAIWDRSVSRRLAGLNSRNEALRAVAAYVKEAMALLGEPFIAWAVRYHVEKEGEDVAVENEGNVGPEQVADGVDLEVQMVNGVELGDANIEENEGNVGPVRVADGVDLEVQTVNGVELGDGDIGENQDNVRGGGSEVAAQRENGDMASRSEVEPQREHGDVASRSEKEAEETNRVSDGSHGSEREARDTIVADASNPLAVTVAFLNSTPGRNTNGVRSRVAKKGKDTLWSRALRHMHGPAKLRDDEDVGSASAGIYNLVSSAEVQKMQENLKSCSSDLKASGTDPLPYALRISETLRSELGTRPEDHVSKGNGSASDDVPQPVGNNRENAGMRDINPRNPSCSHQNVVTRASLMVRNSTAHTYEWDDSPEQSNSRGKLHLPSPKRIAVSPLKKYEDKKVTKRRKAKRWSLQEEETLRTGVQEYGAGNWKLILGAYQDRFDERTEVDLKDKWRNMTR